MRFAGPLALVALLSGAPLAGPALADAETRILGSGRLEGRSSHTAQGGVTVLKTAGGALVVLEADFVFDGAPDPKLAFGKDGYARETLFTKLESNTGAQVYRVPDGIDPTRYDELWIWCEKFGVPLGVASLK